MNTYELIEQLAQKPKEEIKYALLALMLKGQIDFLDLNQAYVAMLEHKSEDKENQLIEAETCVLQSFFLRERQQCSHAAMLVFLESTKEL